MLSYLLQLFDWLRESWSKWKLIWKILSVVLFLSALGLIVRTLPSVGFLKEWYALANPDTQLMFLFAVLIVAFLLFLFAVEERHRVKQLEEDKATADRAKAAAEERTQEAEEEVKRLQSQWDHLLDVGCRDVLWKRQPIINLPEFVPKSNRRTRFLTVLNLKGGVGKTTLAANLAAGLASGTPPLRVLLIDIDFQGTLSRATVEKSLIGEKVNHNSFVHRLLTTSHPDSKLLDQLPAAMSGFANSRVILAEESLDVEDFQLQARFFVEPTCDPRFRFRLHLHQPTVFDKFDVVIFDSPPRVTTSVANALACSDYVLIPTKLDRGSIDAVPRTLGWMKSLGGNCPAEVLGVVASHVAIRVGKLVSADNESYEYLQRVVESNCGDAKKLLKQVVAQSTKAVGGDGEIGSLTTDGQKVFAAVVKEVRERMGL